MKAKIVEIGLLNRETGEIFTTMTEKDEQIYMAIGRLWNDETEEFENAIYAFDSNALLFTLPEKASDATIDREFKKRYKMLKPGAVARMRKEGELTTPKPEYI